MGKPGAEGFAINIVPVRSKINALPSGKKTICIGVVSSGRPDIMVVSVKPVGIEVPLADVLSPAIDGCTKPRGSESRALRGTAGAL